MTKIVTVSNRKGGVGKTTVSTHLAAGLSLLGFSVGLIDTDPQGHCASALGLPKANGLHSLMTHPDAQFSEWTIAVPGESYAVPGWEQPAPMFLIPSDKLTAVIPTTEGVSVFTFRRMIREFVDLYELEFVIIDTSPSNTIFDDSISLATDYFLYVTEVAALSFDGLNEATRELRQTNRDIAEFRTTEIEMLGIIPNKIRASTNNHRDNIRVLAEQFGRDAIWQPITLRTVWESAFEYGQLVYSYEPFGVEFRDAFTLVEHALKQLGELPQDSTLITDMMTGVN